MLSRLNTRGRDTDNVIAFIVRDGHVLRGLRHYSPTEALWTAPGGRCDEDETFETTLRREVAEEIGVTDLMIQDYIGSAPGWQENDTVHIFLCHTDQDAILMEPDKFSEWRWVPLSDYIHGQSVSRTNEATHKLVSDYLKDRFDIT